MKGIGESHIWTPERFERLIEGIDAIVWEADAETWEFTYVSPQAESILGYPVESWLTEPDFWVNMLHPDDREWAAARCREASDRGGDHDLEYRVIAAEGREVWLRDCVKVHVDLDTERRFLRGVMTDITRLKRAEEEQLKMARALRESERQLLVGFESSAVGMVALDLEGRFQRVNRAFCKLTGRSSGELIGMTFDEVTHPDDREAGWRAVTRLIEGEIESYRRKKRYVRPDGEVVWGQLTTTLLRKENGEPAYLVGQVLDVTEQHRQDARFRALVQHSSDVVCIVDREGVVTYVSPSVEKLLGYTPQEILGRPGFDFIVSDQVGAARERLEASARSSEVLRHERTVEARDGSEVHIEVTLTNLLDDPAVNGIVANVHDVTERKEGERALRAVEEQLRQAQKMEAIARLSGGVAHDFNNLLTAILGSCELLLEDPSLPPDLRVQLIEIREAAEVGESVSTQLLDLSRTRTGTPEVVLLPAILERVDSVLRRLLGEAIELVLSIPSEPVTVLVDAGQIEQVILNLAVNAADAMPDGGRFSLTLRTVEVAGDDPLGRFGLEPGTYGLLTATDTGSGMEPSVKERIFEPFFTTKSGSEATGLGLSTAYQIVSEAGGHIMADSVVGSGTTFTIYLPFAEAEVAAGRVAREKPSAAVRGTILLVEDDPRVRSVAERVLRADGHRVIAASDGFDALERFSARSGPIDVVVTDVVMRGMGGPALVERLLAQDPDIRVVYISGYTAEHSAATALSDGAMFLAKPFRPRQLAAAVRQALAGRVPQ